MSDMEALAARVEAATGPDRELDKAIGKFNGWNYGPPFYTASLDAAMTLVPEGADWYVTAIRPLTGRFAGAIYEGPHPSIQYGEAATPALALTAAALRARAHLTAGATHDR